METQSSLWNIRLEKFCMGCAASLFWGLVVLFIPVIAFTINIVWVVFNHN